MQTLQQIKEAFASNQKKVITRLDGDLDSYLSVCLYAYLAGCLVTDLKISFVPSGAFEIPVEVVGLDVTAGFKGVKHSCFEELVQGLCSEQEHTNLAALAKYVTLQSQNKLSTLPPNILVGSLAAQIAILKASDWKDLQILAWMAPLFEAHAKGLVPESHVAKVMDSLFTQWLKAHFNLEGSLDYDGTGHEHSQFERWVAKLSNADDREALNVLSQHVTLQVTGKLSEQPAHVQVGLLGTQLLMLKSLGWTRKQLVAWLEPLFAGHLKCVHKKT